MRHGNIKIIKICLKVFVQVKLDLGGKQHEYSIG